MKTGLFRLPALCTFSPDWLAASVMIARLFLLTAPGGLDQVGSFGRFPPMS
jgi:hypothetical protein